MAEAQQREDERRKVVRGKKELERDKAQKEAMDQITREIAAEKATREKSKGTKGSAEMAMKGSQLES